MRDKERLKKCYSENVHVRVCLFVHVCACIATILMYFCGGHRLAFTVILLDSFKVQMSVYVVCLLVCMVRCWSGQ